MKKVIVILFVLTSTMVQAQNSLRPIVGYGINEGIHVGMNYRMNNIQFYSGYGRFETSPTFNNKGHFFWGGVQFYFGKSRRVWKSWYLKIGLLRSYSLEEFGEREYELECRIGREFMLSDNVSMAIDLGLSRDLEDFSNTSFAYLLQGGVYFLYNLRRN